MNRMTVSVSLVASFAFAAACSSGLPVPPSGGSIKTGGSAGGATSFGGTTGSGGIILVGGRDAGVASEVAPLGDGGRVVEGLDTGGNSTPGTSADVPAGGQDSVAEAGGRADCDPPPGIANGLVMASNTTLGSTATYRCNTGYSLTGVGPIRTCQADGTWGGTAPTCTVQMLKVTINKTGAGTVSSVPLGIACGSTCQATYAYGSAVTLSARPDANQYFLGWDSTACTESGACAFTLTENTVVKGSFSLAPNIVFTTSTTQTAALGGLAGADTICATLAANAGLAGNFVAWLSTSKVNAISRLGNASGWIRPDGKPVFKTVADIAQGKLLYPPRLDERGRDLGVDPLVMTGTWSDGTVAFPTDFTTCGEFTSAVVVQDPYMALSGGYASANSEMFTNGASIDCDTNARLYCFGIDRQAEIVVIPAAGRYAFATVAPWTSGGGIASADTLCQSEASNAALPGTYKALLAPTGASAASRFDTSGLPWIRPDGILIAPTASVFFSTTLFDASPNITADGSVCYGSNGVWSGAATATTKGTDARNCVNWTSASESQTGGTGAAGDTSTAAYFNRYANSNPCSANSTYLTCLQE